MILVTGGCGYIGSHIVVELSSLGFDILIVDNLSNSYESVIDKFDLLTGTTTKVAFIKLDLVSDNIWEALKDYDIEAVIHLAAKKYVNESVEDPIMYYRNNINSLINLLEFMKQKKCFKLIFSSSCTVYGKHPKLPLDEKSPMVSESPYGLTKVQNEELLIDLCKFDSQWSCISLRYFNPLGSHKSGLIKENPKEKYPQNLMPNLLKCVNNSNEEFKIFGNDYDTPDGTCIRDYIHVVDLAKAHVKALKLLDKVGYNSINIGTGIGYSVLDVVKTMEKVCKKSISQKIYERRKGDVPIVYANAQKASMVLKWNSLYNLEDMCLDSI